MECSWLAIVVLGKGFEVIGKWAFRQCTSLQRIVIPPSIRVIAHEEAFDGCSPPGEGRINLNLLADCNMSNAGGKGVYFTYTGQARRNIPRDVIGVRVHPSIRRIKDWAFNHCRHDCNSQQRAGGDWGRGILPLHIAK
jgi:hypothetical protein